MIRLLILSTLSLLLTTSAFAQMPEAVMGTGKLGSEFSLNKMACADQDSGTITFGTFTGSSDDVDPATPIFLCFGDTYEINHDGNQDLTGDPQMTTNAGVTYLFYEGPPTVSGPNLSTIITDPQIILNPTPDPDPDDNFAPVPFFTTGSTGDINGNITLENTGAIQTFFSSGAPTQIWFAPITLDNFAGNGYEINANTGELGPCVNANINEAFSVVFLNELTATNQTSNSTCSGSLTISGGLSEFDGSDYAAIAIISMDNPAVLGEVTSGAATHGDVIEFTVPEEGNYFVVVEDGKNCEVIIPFTFTPADDLELTVSNEVVPTGGSVCVSVTANNFTEMITTQTTINYDGSVLSFTGFDNLNPNVPGLAPSLTNNAPNSAILMSWFDPATTGVTIPDGSVLFDICFDVIGTGGDVSPFAFDESILVDEAFNPCGQIGMNTAAGSVTVSVNSFEITTTSADESCGGESDGEFTITATGGTAPFNISWVGAATGPNTGSPVINTNGGSFTAMDLAPDDYTITVEDVNGSIVMENITITAGFNFGVSLDYTLPTCADQCDGSMVANIIVNGTPITPGPEYTFSWSTGETTQTLTNLCNIAGGGNYAVTVTGPGMCESTANESVSNVLPIAVNPAVTASFCSPVNDGSINLNISGGTISPGGAYSTEWLTAPSPISNNITNVGGLEGGIYEVMITDDIGCSATFFIEVAEVKVLTIDETVVGINCNGDENGSISVVANTSGGMLAPPYTFFWNPSNLNPVTTANTSTVSDLSAGSYLFILNDADGCSADTIFVLQEPMVLDVTEVQTTGETCATGMDGTATIAVAGGVFPYLYDWGVPGQTDSTAVNLEAGTYTVTVTDANMCTGTLALTIDSPMPPMTTLDDTTVDCNGSADGTLTVVITPGGSPVTSIQWTSGGTDVGTTETITGLTPGQYEVAIMAGDGCTTFDTAMVNQPDPLAVTSLNIGATNCPGSGGGLVSVILEGGVQPYDFNWSNGTSGENVSTITGSDIVGGDYTVTITYSDGCADSLVLNATVPEPPSITGTFSGIDGVSCFNLSGVPADGQATVIPFYEGDPGNTAMQTWNITWQTLDIPPTIYLQENGVETSSATNLPQDEQFVIVSDGQCFDTLSVNIPAPEPLLATGSTIDVSCFGDTDGSVNVMGTGGTGDYMYQWSTGEVNVTTVDNQPPGEITVVITDENNCNFTFLADVGEPDPFVVDTVTESQLAVSCHSGNDAIISLFTIGGNPGVLTYDWEDNIAAPNESIAQNVGAGAWSVTVTDERGCMDDLTVLVTEPDTILFTYSVDTIQCNGGTTEFRIDTVTGGTVDGFIEYRYSLNINPFPVNIDVEQDISAGEYTVSVFDNNDCEVSETFILNEPNPLTVILPEVIEIELGDSLTQLLPTIINDFPLDSILWTPAMSGLSNDTILNPFVRNSVDDQVYALNLVDANGCTGSDQVLVKIDRNRNIYIPNVFSPNNDGYNDKFGVFGCLGVSKIISAHVFDRWGELVATTGTDGLLPECESPNGSVIWDGMFRGKRAPDGVYVYVIDVEFLDKKRLVYRGDVTVLK